MSEARASSATGVSRAWSWILIGALAYYAFRLLCYAILLHPLVPPDEMDLFGTVQAYARTWWIPPDTVTAAHLISTGRPKLYFWLMGRLLALNVFGMDDLQFARLLQVPIALVTAVYVWRVTAFFTDRPAVRMLIVVILTNTLQFSTLSATVTYDNLYTCLTVMASYHLFRLFPRVEWDGLLAFLTLAGLACLVKEPTGTAILGALLLWRRRRSLLSDIAHLRATFEPTRGRLARLALCLAVLALSAQLYVGNLIVYGKVFTQPLDVLPRELALRNRIVRRDFIVDEYRAGHLDYEQALRETDKIPNAGNRARARQLLGLARDPGQLAAKRVTFDTYLFVWAQLMLERSIGYQGNGGKVIPPARPVRAAVLVLFIAAVLLCVRRVRASDSDGVVVYASAATLLYSAVIIFVMTYPLYVAYGAIDNAVNGRYLFPVLPLMLSVLCGQALRGLPSRGQIAALTLVGALFVFSDFPYFISHVDRCWFTGAQRFSECTY